MDNPTRMNISSTRHLGHRRIVHGSGEDDSRKLFVSSFLWKEEPPTVGALSTMAVRKSGLGLLNPATSVKEKYLCSTRGSADLIQAATRVGVFFNADHLQTLSQERRDGK